MKRKVLFCTADYSAFTEPVSSAFISLGYDIKLFDYQKGNLLSRSIGLTGNIFHFPKGFIRPIILNTIQSSLLKAVKQWKPDVVFVIKGETISKETLLALNKLGVITLNWYPDWMVLWNWVKEYAPLYTWFIVTCEDLYKHLKKIHPRVRYLPYASQPDEIVHTKQKKYNLVFVGQYSKRREYFFGALADLGLIIWGYTNWRNSELKNLVHSPVSPQQTLEIFRQSKIVVNVQTGDDYFYPHAINNRTFETLGVGTLLLIHDYPLIHKHFNVKNSMVTFRSKNELRQKAIYYLTHSLEREKIARNGWLEVKKHHLYVQRLQELLSLTKI